MSIISTRTRRVKATRHTARPAAPFGAGLTRYVPFAVTAPGFVEPSDADRAWAAENLNAEGDDGIADMEDRALEAAYHDSIEHLQPGPAGICRSCGISAAELSWDMCEDCFDRAATDAATMCQTGLRRVY